MKAWRQFFAQEGLFALVVNLLATVGIAMLLTSVITSFSNGKAIHTNQDKIKDLDYRVRVLEARYERVKPALDLMHLDTRVEVPR